MEIAACCGEDCKPLVLMVERTSFTFQKMLTNKIFVSQESIPPENFLVSAICLKPLAIIAAF